MRKQGHRPRIVVLGNFERGLPRLADWRSIHARADVQMHHDPLAGPGLVEALKDADAAVLVRDSHAF